MLDDDDLESGQGFRKLTRWNSPNSAGGFGSLESAAFLANRERYRSENERIDGYARSDEEDEEEEREEREDYINGVPRRKVEQLMKLWIEVFQQSLRTTTGPSHNAESPSSGVLHTVTGNKTPRPNTPNEKDCFSGGIKLFPNDAVGDPLWAEKVDVMTENQIGTEKESRRSVREEWRFAETRVDLEDCWKHLWEPKSGVDTGLFQWSYPEEKRKSLQLDLVDALNAPSELVTVKLYMRRDYRSIAAWISLIGLRLNDINRSIYDTPRITPAKQIEILIECLWCCNSYSSKLEMRPHVKGPTVGDVLTSCYKRRVLAHPMDGLFHAFEIREHCWYVRRALYLLNILYKHHPPRFEPREDIERTWKMPLSILEATLREPSSGSDLNKRKDAFFDIDDFNLKDLQSLGHIQLQWTCYWDEHLQLETSSVGNVLKIYWFQPSLARYFVENRLCAKIESDERQRREYEICATWSIIFTSNRKETKSRDRYAKLRAPRWMSLLAHSRLGTWDSEQEIRQQPEQGPQLSRFMDESTSSDFCFETRDHLLLQWSNPARKTVRERLSYSQFPIYGDRIRQLRAYMDTQQPRGLRALWRDKRNSNSYYTFWFVVIFGSLSVFLGTCALAVSIAQTWATFQGLSPSND